MSAQQFTPLRYTQSKENKAKQLIVNTPQAAYTIEALQDLIDEAVEASRYKVTSVCADNPQNPALIKQAGITLGRDQTRVPEARINQSSSVQQARKREGKER